MPNVFAAVRHPTPHPIRFRQLVGRFADRSPSRVVGVVVGRVVGGGAGWLAVVLRLVWVRKNAPLLGRGIVGRFSRRGLVGLVGYFGWH